MDRIHTRIIAFFLAFSLSVATLQAQSDNWRSVENLESGTPISVEAHHRVSCLFLRATDDALFCEFVANSRFETITRTLKLDRRDIRQVGMGKRYSPAKDAAIGAAVGGAIGAALPEKYGSTRVGGALLLGLIGGTVGWVVAGNKLHYQVVYER